MHPRKKRALGRLKGGGYIGKVAVMGLLERNTPEKKSRIRTAVVPNARKHHLHEQIAKHVEDGTTVYTDAEVVSRASTTSTR